MKKIVLAALFTLSLVGLAMAGTTSSVQAQGKETRGCTRNITISITTITVPKNMYNDFV